MRFSSTKRSGYSSHPPWRRRGPNHSDNVPSNALSTGVTRSATDTRGNRLPIKSKQDEPVLTDHPQASEGALLPAAASRSGTMLTFEKASDVPRQADAFSDDDLFRSLDFDDSFGSLAATLHGSPDKRLSSQDRQSAHAVAELPPATEDDVVATSTAAYSVDAQTRSAAEEILDDFDGDVMFAEGELHESDFSVTDIQPAPVEKPLETVSSDDPRPSDAPGSAQYWARRLRTIKKEHAQRVVRPNTAGSEAEDVDTIAGEDNAIHDSASDRTVNKVSQGEVQGWIPSASHTPGHSVPFYWRHDVAGSGSSRQPSRYVRYEIDWEVRRPEDIFRQTFEDRVARGRVAENLLARPMHYGSNQPSCDASEYRGAAPSSSARMSLAQWEARRARGQRSSPHTRSTGPRVLSIRYDTEESIRNRPCPGQGEYAQTDSILPESTTDQPLRANSATPVHASPTVHPPWPVTTYQNGDWRQMHSQVTAGGNNLSPSGEGLQSSANQSFSLVNGSWGSRYGGHGDQQSTSAPPLGPIRGVYWDPSMMVFGPSDLNQVAPGGSQSADAASHGDGTPWDGTYMLVPCISYASTRPKGTIGEAGVATSSSQHSTGLDPRAAPFFSRSSRAQTWS